MFQIFVGTETDLTLTLDVTASDTISNVMDQIKAKSNWNLTAEVLEMVSLFFEGDHMVEDGTRTLSDYNIRDQSKIWLILKSEVSEEEDEEEEENVCASVLRLECCGLRLRMISISISISISVLLRLRLRIADCGLQLRLISGGLRCVLCCFL